MASGTAGGEACSTRGLWDRDKIAQKLKVATEQLEVLRKSLIEFNTTKEHALQSDATELKVMKEKTNFSTNRS